MEWILLIACYITGGVIFYHDIKYRAVTWIAFPVLLVAGILFNLVEHQQLSILFANVLLNTCFLGIQFLLLWLYFLVKKNRSSLQSGIGGGDILFLFASCFFFSPLNFLLFYISSLIFSLATFLILSGRINKKRAEVTVPMAGLQSIFLQLFLTINVVFKNSFTSDSWILNRILLNDN